MNKISHDVREANGCFKRIYAVPKQVICSCGCGETVELKPWHYGKRIPKYKQGHRAISNITKRRMEKIQPPPCKCGCGEKITLQYHHNHYKVPDYILGHNHKNLPEGNPELERKKRQLREQMKNPEIVKKVLRRRPMSSLEIKFNEIIQKNNLPYKFVGNGEVMIGRKNPDFVNCNGEKIAVEVYYRKHKEQFRDGLDSWKQNRESIFKEYGWSVVFFDETEVTEENLKKSLGGDSY